MMSFIFEFLGERNENLPETYIEIVVQRNTDRGDRFIDNLINFQRCGQCICCRILLRTASASCFGAGQC